MILLGLHENVFILMSLKIKKGHNNNEYNNKCRLDYICLYTNSLTNYKFLLFFMEESTEVIIQPYLL